MGNGKYGKLLKATNAKLSSLKGGIQQNNAAIAALKSSSSQEMKDLFTSISEFAEMIDEFAKTPNLSQQTSPDFAKQIKDIHSSIPSSITDFQKKLIALEPQRHN